MTSVKLRLSGKLSDGTDISLENMTMSLLNKQIDLWKALIASDEDVKISLETGSLLMNVAMSVAAVLSLEADYANYSQGKIDTIGKGRLKAMRALERGSRNGNLHHSVTAGNKVIYDSKGKSTPISKSQYESIEETELEGMILDMGGKGDKPNIHIAGSRGVYTVTASREQLSALKRNLLYKYARLHVSYKYNHATGEMRDYRLKAFVDEVEYSPELLEKMIDRERPSWSDVLDVEDWLSNYRGEID